MRGEDPEKGKTLSEVTLREGETQDSLLKRFNTAVQKSGLLREVKRKRFFVSKGEAARECRVSAQLDTIEA